MNLIIAAILKNNNVINKNASIQHDKSRKPLQYLQEKIAEIANRSKISNNLLVKDRLLLSWKKSIYFVSSEALLHSRTKPEMDSVRSKFQRLEKRPEPGDGGVKTQTASSQTVWNCMGKSRSFCNIYAVSSPQRHPPWMTAAILVGQKEHEACLHFSSKTTTHCMLSLFQVRNEVVIIVAMV